MHILYVLCFRYRQLNPLCFSLALSGVLVRRNPQRQQSSTHEAVSERDSSHSFSLRECVAAHKERSKKENEEHSPKNVKRNTSVSLGLKEYVNAHRDRSKKEGEENSVKHLKRNYHLQVCDSSPGSIFSISG